MSEAGPTKISDAPFVNEVRLNARHWCVALGILIVAAATTPPLWKKLERFDTGPDYRVPYSLSKDYWLYQRRLERISPTNIVVLGDSVVWGEYVLPDGTLPHFLNRQAGASNLFVNAGVNGLFPLALEGLVRCYAQPLHDRKVLLHCNLLWMTSPRADLSTEKEEPFNHSALVPQFFPRIPCYRADAIERLNAVVERNMPFFQWAGHLQNAYFGQKSIPKWTLNEESGSNAYRNPFSQITLTVPPEPREDPQRGPESPRHKPWSTNGVGATYFEWVDPAKSLQWAAFRRLVEELRARKNEVLVVLGPFNEHMMAPENRAAYGKILTEITCWFQNARVAYVAPDPLPSSLYADASHPLTAGYELLAKRLYHETNFKRWSNALSSSVSSPASAAPGQ